MKTYLTFVFIFCSLIYTVFVLVNSLRPTGYYIQILIYPPPILTLKLTQLYEY